MGSRLSDVWAEGGTAGATDAVRGHFGRRALDYEEGAELLRQLLARGGSQDEKTAEVELDS